MKRCSSFFMLLVIVLSTFADEETFSVCVYHNGAVIVYPRELVDSMSFEVPDCDSTVVDILTIHIKEDETDEYKLSTVDSVVFTPPAAWILTNNASTTYTTATLKALVGGSREVEWKKVEAGFVVSEKKQPILDTGALWINYGTLSEPGYIEKPMSNRFVGDKTYYYQAYIIYKGKIFGSTKTFRLQPVIIWTDTYTEAEKDEGDDDYYQAKVMADIFGDTDEIKREPNAKIGFFYGLEDNLSRDSKNAIRINGYFNEVNDIEAMIRRLEPCTKYYYRPFVEIADTIYYGISASFITGPSIKVKTDEATNIGAVSANVSYSVEVKMYEEQPKSGVVGIQYGETFNLDQLGENTYYVLDNWSPEADIKQYYANFTKMTPERTYYYRAFAIINGIRYYGNTQSFTTKNISVATYDAKDVKKLTAHVDGELLDKDAINDGDNFGFFINSIGNPDSSNSFKASGVFTEDSDGIFSWDISGLYPSTIYYYRAFITYRGETYLGEVKSFTTDEGFIGELGLFELKGGVKSCEWKNLYGESIRFFDRNGMWIYNNNESIESIYSFGIERDKLGRIITGSYDEGGQESWIYDDLGRKTCYTDVYYDGGEKHTYSYGDHHLVVKETVEMIGMDVYYNENYTLTYKDYVLDSHGNWISRTRIDSTEGSSTETRSITYYELPYDYK